jgi:simple sugar transport system permease protein
LDLQAIPQLPFMRNPVLGVWLTMIPYAFTIIVLLLASGETLRRRWGAPAALGTPYVRGERGV